MGEELIDLLDCDGSRTGDVIGRDAAHATGAWHGAFHCLVVYPRDGRPVALFQKRSTSKTIAPGRYDVSAGGHYAAGEGPEQAGPREIGEELGMDVAFDRLVPLGRRVFVHCFTPGVRELEFQDVFLLPLPQPPERLSLQEGEVDALLELDLEAGIALFAGRIRQAEGVLTGRDGSRQRATAARDEFVPCVDAYYLKLLQLARRYAAGERDALAI